MRISALILLCFVAQFGYAQKRISGFLTDANGVPLENASIFLKGGRLLTTTDKNGAFSFEYKQDESICFSHFGFSDTCLNASELSENSIKIRLNEKKIVAEEIIVSSKSNMKIIRSAQTGLFEIRTDSLRSLPNIVGEADPIKMLQLSPGVTKSDFNMGLNVRGSTTDQNLVLIDDAAIYNPTHLAGFLSVFNPLVVEKVSLLKSGIPAEYGGRVSSITIVETDKNLASKTETEGNVGILLSGFVVKTPLLQDKASFQVSARRSYFDQTIKPISKILFKNGKSMFNSTDYAFYDVNASLIIAPSKNDKVFISCYVGNDDFSLSKTSFNLQYNMQWSNQAFSLKWMHHFSSRHIMKTIAYSSKGDFAIFLGQNDFNFRLNSSIEDLSAIHEHTFFFGHWSLKTGAQVLKQHILPNKSKAELIDFNTDFGTPNTFNTLTFSPYIQSEVNVSKSLALNIGLRYNEYLHFGPFERFVRDNGIDITDTLYYKKNETVKKYNNFEPRFALRYLINSYSSLKFSVTHNIQYLQQINVSAVSFPTDFWMPASYQLAPQKGWQFSLGYFSNLFDSSYCFSTEVFYKHMVNLTEFKKGILSTVSKASMEENIITGEGRAYGIEFLIEKKTGELTGWISYTLSRSERIFKEINNGNPYPSKYDRTHDLSIVTQYKINEKWNASAIFVIASGNAFTLPYGRYMIGENIVNQYSDYNSFRMPVYHRLDMSVTRKFKTKGKAEHSLDIGIYNVYSRLNPYFMYFDVSGDLEKYKLKVSPRYVSVFPILPSVSYHFKF